MKSTNFFIKRRISTLCLNIGIVALGLFCLSKTSIDLFPPANLPTITVVISAPGLNAREIEKQVTVPLEELFNTLPHLKKLWSKSESNQSTFLVKFKWGTSVDFSALGIRESIKNVSLPAASLPPVIFRWNPSEQPILRADLYSPVALSTLTEIVDSKIQPQLERIKGVAKVEVDGSRYREIKVSVNSHRLAASGLSLFHVVEGLKGENIHKQVGTFHDGHYEMLLKIDSQLHTTSDLENIPIYSHPKKLFKLSDFAQIKESFKTQKIISRVNLKDSISLSIKKSHDAATLDVIHNVKAQLAKLTQEDSRLKVIYSKDNSEYIETSRKVLFGNLWQGALLTFIFVFLFLRSLGSTLIICFSIPISIIGTFALMKYFNISQNVFSLAGIALACGMVVDSAVVILENIHRHFHEEGKSAVRAAVEGTQEVGIGVITSVITTLVIFIPIVYCVKGIIGILFNDIAFTFVVALSLSLVVGFTLIPCLAAFMLQKGQSITAAKKYKVIEYFYRQAGKIREMILNGLSYLIDHKKHALLFLSLVYGSCILSIFLLPGLDLIPLGEFKNFKVTLEAPAQTHLSELDTKAAPIEKYLMDKKEIQTVASRLEKNKSIHYVTLKKGQTSLKKAHLYLGGIRQELSKYPSLTIEAVQVPKLDTTEGQGTPILLILKHPDHQKRDEIAYQIIQNLKKIPDLLYVKKRDLGKRSEIQVIFNKRKIKEHGLSTEALSHLIYSNLEGVKASSIYKPNSAGDFPIRVIEHRKKQATLEDLNQLPILSVTKNNKRHILPLNTFADIQETQKDIAIERTDNTPSTSIVAQLKSDRRSLQEIRADISLSLNAHPNWKNAVSIESTLNVLKETFSGLFIALLISIMLVYMILAAQFESFSQPLSLILTLPLAVIGVFIGTTLWGFHLDVIVMLGCILLVGITVDTGILIIEYTNILRRRGMDRKQALLTAIRHRMRPILITALTDIFGSLPMALSSGAGAEMYQGFGVTTVFGLATATGLTLFSLPLTYILFEDIEEYIRLKLLWIQSLNIKERTSL